MTVVPEGGAPAGIRLPKVDVFVGRAAEQSAFAASSLLLAHLLGPEGFAPVGILFVVNTLSVTLSDLGIGTRLLRLVPGRTVDRGSVLRMRQAAAGVVVALLVGVALTSGDVREVLVASAVIWPLAAELSLRKGAALRAGAGRRVAASEVVGSAALLLWCGLAFPRPEDAILWVAAGLVTKSLCELVLSGSPRWAVGDAVRDRDALGVWLSAALAYVIANVDYVLVGALLGERALATYLLAFRLANAVPSQVAFVAGRLATVDLASGQPSDRQARYERYTGYLFAAGAVGAAITVVALPALDAVLGDDWPGAAWTLGVLVLAAPWRAVLGISGTLALVSGSADRLSKLEVGRLAVTAALLAGAAAAGFGWLLAASVALPVVATVVYHAHLGAIAGLRHWKPLVPAAAVTAGLVVAATGAGWDVLRELA